MDIRLTRADSALQEKARDFTAQVLIPLEDECEERDGLSASSAAAAKQAVLDWGFNAINHPASDGGQGYDLFQQMLDRGAVGTRDRRAVGHPVAAVDPAAARHRGAEGAVPASRHPR